MARWVPHNEERGNDGEREEKVYARDEERGFYGEVT